MFKSFPRQLTVVASPTDERDHVYFYFSYCFLVFFASVLVDSSGDNNVRCCHRLHRVLLFVLFVYERVVDGIFQSRYRELDLVSHVKEHNAFRLLVVFFFVRSDAGIAIVLLFVAIFDEQLREFFARYSPLRPVLANAFFYFVICSVIFTPLSSNAAIQERVVIVRFNRKRISRFARGAHQTIFSPLDFHARRRSRRILHKVKKRHQPERPVRERRRRRQRRLRRCFLFLFSFFPAISAPTGQQYSNALQRLKRPDNPRRHVQHALLGARPALVRRRWRRIRAPQTRSSLHIAAPVTCFFFPALVIHHQLPFHPNARSAHQRRPQLCARVRQHVPRSLIIRTIQNNVRISQQLHRVLFVHTFFDRSI